VTCVSEPASVASDCASWFVEKNKGLVRKTLQAQIASVVFHNLAAHGHTHLSDTYTTVVRRLQKLGRINPRIFLGSDIYLSITQTYFYVLNASLASEVLFHPVCSKVSSHAFDAHFHVLDLRLRMRHQRGDEQQQHR
jgi:hypothetical protein